MRTFEEYLQEQFTKDKEFEKEFYRGLEKTRIAAEIAYFREKRGLTQAQLAKILNTSQSTIARLENPNYRSYSLKTLRKIADALGLELVVSLKEKEIKKYSEEDFSSKLCYISDYIIERRKNDYCIIQNETRVKNII